MNKITKILLIIVCFLLVVYLILNGYVKDSENMAKLVGNKIGGGELTMSNYYSLSQCAETYFHYLRDKDYETAYKMLNNNYKEYISFEKYKEKVIKNNYENTEITDINPITKTTYNVITDVSGEKENCTIILNNDGVSFLLLPDNFLDYQKINKKVSKKSLECYLTNYVVTTTNNTFKFSITNKSSEDINIASGKLITNLDDNLECAIDINILPKETKEISVSFVTDYAFPKKIILYRNIGNNLTEYAFNIDK